MTIEEMRAEIEAAMRRERRAWMEAFFRWANQEAERVEKECAAADSRALEDAMLAAEDAAYLRRGDDSE